MLLRTIILLISICFITRTTAQNTLNGTVKDKAGSFIADANVYLLKTQDSSIVSQTFTNEMGFFSLPLPDYTAFLIRLTHVGYKDTLLKVSRADVLHTALTIELQNSLNVLSEVTIQSGARPIRQKDGNFVYAIAGEKEFKTAANLTDVFRLLPNLRLDADGSLYLANNVMPVIFVDGKPLMISNEERNAFLRSLTPEKVANIEIITNPSAQYDGEFKGIINITLKKDENIGFVGTFNSMLRQNRKTYGEQNLSLDYNTEKAQYFTRLGYNYGTTVYRFRALQHLANKNILHTLLNDNTLNNSWNIQTGVNFRLKEKHQFGILLRSISVNTDRDRRGNLLSTDAEGKTLVFDRVSINPVDYNQNQTAATVNYTGQAKKLKLDFLSNYLSVNNRQSDIFTETHQQNGSLQQQWISNMKNNIRIFTAQVDIAYPIKNGSLQSGIKFSTSATDNQIRYDTLAVKNDYQLDSSRSNRFKYDEDISAAYISYSQKIEKLQLNAGLRIEQTQSVANSITLDSVVNRKFINGLPSFSATYSIDGKQDISATFSRRITRPTFGLLNPFRIYNSAFNYWIGNPFLLPSKTTQFKLGYRYKRVQTELNIGKEKDVMIRYPLYDSTTNQVAFLGKNIPYRHFTNLSFSTPVNFTKWWSSTLQIMGYYNKENMPYLDKVYSFSIYNYILRWNQVFSLPKSFTLSLMPVYESKTGNSLYMIKARPYMDISLQKSWLNNKLNTKLAFIDMFNTDYTYLIFRYKEIIDNQFSHWWGQQRVQLNVTYNFGTSKSKVNNRTVSDEERRI